MNKEEFRNKWGPRLAAHLGQEISFDGDIYELVKFDFSTDRLWIRPTGADHSDDPEICSLYACFDTCKEVRLIKNTRGYIHAPITETLPTRENNMSIQSIVFKCKTAAVSAAEYQAGKALNLALIKAAKPHAPMMVRGYLDHALAAPVLAIALSVVMEYLPKGSATTKIQRASQLMISAAFLDGADKLLDVEKIMDSIMSKVPPKALEVLKDQA